MEFFRYLFLLLVLTGSTSIGFLLSKKYSDRLIELNNIGNLINILQNKIKFTHKPLREVLEETASIKENTRISEIFLKTGQKLKNQRIEEAWNESISEQRFFLNLESEDINLLKTLGNVLGKTDVEGQMSEINQFNTLLKVQIKNAEEERNKNAKMYKSLGTIIGLAIVIILF